MATIVTRAGKGSPLTHDEVDDNFDNLNTDKLETSGDGSGLTNIARKVWESSQGSGSSANYWAKVATYDISGDFNDGSFIYHFVPEEFGTGMPAIVAVNVRNNNASGGDSHTLNVELMSKPHAYPFSDDSFKLIDNGGSSDIELWVKKNDNYGQVVMYEMSAHVEDSTFTIAYNQNAAWQSSEPTGSGLNIKTVGVKVAGNFTASGTVTATAFAGNGSALTGLATAAQGTLADSAVQPNDSPTFAGLTTTANVSFGDADKATFGDGNDLEIFHSGTSSYIRDVGNGDLQIFATDDVYIRGYATNNYMARFAETGAVTLYHNNSAKLATSSTGVNVAGDLTLDASNAEVNLKSGGTGTSGAVNWIFNSTGTNYASISLPYDTRTTTGLLIDSGYPITVDAYARIDFDISGTTKASLNSTGLDVTGNITAAGTEPRITLSETDTSAQHRILSSNGALFIQAEDSDGTTDGDMYLTGMNSQDARLITLRAVTVTMNGDLEVDGDVQAATFTGDGSALTGIAAGATGGGNDDIFYENGQNVTTNYTITNGKNAMSAGPITVDSGVTVTVGAGETWTVV